MVPGMAIGKTAGGPRERKKVEEGERGEKWERFDC